MDISIFNHEYRLGEKFRKGLFSDLHLDAKDHDQASFERDIEDAINRGCRILLNGDIFEAIFNGDKRMTNENSIFAGTSAQVNKVVQYNVNRLKRYADHIDYIAYGNHEASCVKYSNIDLLQLLVYDLNKERSKKLEPIRRGAYQGFLRFWFRDKGGRVRKYDVFRTHGKGGSAVVTRGMIDFNRLYTSFDAHLYWVGHKHVHIVDAGKTVLRMTPNNLVEAYRKRGVITGCYKKSFEIDDYAKLDEDGLEVTYRPSYSEERFYGAQDQGYAELILQPQSDGGVRDWLKVG